MAGLLPAMLIVIVSGACSGEKKAVSVDQTETASPTLANPAACKCIGDGYKLQPIIENGVSVGYRCVDPVSGKACGVWEYFRGNCRFPDADKHIRKQP